MSKVSDKDLVKVIEIYNSNGKEAAYKYLTEQHGIKYPYNVIKRLQTNEKNNYDKGTDSFRLQDESLQDSIFMSMEQLCSPMVMQHEQPLKQQFIDNRPVAMEKLIHELVGDRLLELSKYIRLDSTTRTMIVDQTSLKNAGYRLITH